MPSPSQSSINYTSGVPTDVQTDAINRFNNHFANSKTYGNLALHRNQVVVTDNFVVYAQDGRLAQEIASEAERLRKSLSKEWFGTEKANWSSPLVITAVVDPRKGAGGETVYNPRPGMEAEFVGTILQGSRERVLDAVLPHELTHALHATHFKDIIPRWADDGSSTTVESDIEKHKHDKMLLEFLRTNRAFSFNNMFSMKDYPSDILPLYAQGFSLVKFLINKGEAINDRDGGGLSGKQRFVKFLERGLETKNWESSAREFYNYSTLGEMQRDWNGSIHELAMQNKYVGNDNFGRKLEKDNMPSASVPETSIAAQTQEQLRGEGIPLTQSNPPMNNIVSIETTLTPIPSKAPQTSPTAAAALETKGSSDSRPSSATTIGSLASNVVRPSPNAAIASTLELTPSYPQTVSNSDKLANTSDSRSASEDYSNRPLPSSTSAPRNTPDINTLTLDSSLPPGQERILESEGPIDFSTSISISAPEPAISSSNGPQISNVSNQIFVQDVFQGSIRIIEPSGIETFQSQSDFTSGIEISTAPSIGLPSESYTQTLPSRNFGSLPYSAPSRYLDYQVTNSTSIYGQVVPGAMIPTTGGYILSESVISGPQIGPTISNIDISHSSFKELVLPAAPKLR